MSSCSRCKKISSSLCICGNLTIKGQTTIEENLIVKDGVLVEGSADILGNTMVVGNSTISGNLVVAGTSSFTGDATFKNIKAENIITDSFIGEISCLEEKVIPPPIKPLHGCYWVADSTASIPKAPLNVSRSSNIPHYQDDQGRDNLVDLTPTDPFHGWWVAILKGVVRYSGTNYTVPKIVFIDTTKNPIELYAYGGTIDHPRELGPTEISTGVRTYKRVDEKTIEVTATLNSALIPSLRLQDDGSLAGYQYISTYSQGAGAAWLLYKIKEPKIRPYGIKEYAFEGQTSDEDCNNPVFMFNEFCNIQLNEQPMTNPRMGYVQYPGYLKFRELQDLLLTTGVEYVTKITGVQKTFVSGGIPITGTPAQLNPPRFVTVLICDLPHHVNHATDVEIRGGQGPLSILNGKHETLIVSNLLFADNDSNYMNPSTRKFKFAIEKDTSFLASDNLNYVTDSLDGLEVYVKIGPIKKGSEYRQLMAAQAEMQYSMFQFSTHSNLSVYRASSGITQNKVIPTFSELQNRVLSNSLVVRALAPRYYNLGSSMYNNIQLNLFPGAVPGAQFTDYNNPFGIGFNTAFNYNISLNNYLDDAPGFEPRNIWWRLDGASTDTVQQQAGTLYYNNPAIGQTFISIVSPLGVVPPPVITPQGSIRYFQLGNTIPNVYSATQGQQYIFGRIKPSYVNGKNIGYIRVKDMSWNDSGNYMFIRNLAPKPPTFPIDTTINNPRANVEAACRVWSAGMKYIIDTLKCEQVIFDIRENNGGTNILPYIMASFFGGDRKGSEDIYARCDTGFSNLIKLSDKNIYNDAFNKSLEPFGTILPNKSDLYYPGSVLKGVGKKIYILTSNGAASAADVMPHLFMGDNLDKKIGNDVISKIFGDMNGILSGGLGVVSNQTTSGTSFIVNNSSGNPFIFNTIPTENSRGVTKMKAEPLSLNNRCKEFKLDNPSPNYLGNCPWGNNWKDNAYHDIGAIHPYGLSEGLKLPGDPRDNPNILSQYPASPSDNDKKLWRDCWLEQTIHDILG